MGQMSDSESTDVENKTTMERVSDQEYVVTRSFDAPAHIVFEAWSKPELFKQWWVPKSFGMTLLSCKMDVRVGGKYRLELGHLGSEQPMAFFGSYIVVEPNARIAWTNEESEDGAVTTVTFEERDGKTILVMHNLHPSKEALDNEISSGGATAMREQFDELEAMLTSWVSADIPYQIQCPALPQPR